MSVDIDQMTEAYLAIRTARDELSREFEEKDAALKQDLSQLEAELLSVCNEINVDSLKTKHGTIMRKLSERFFCSDYDNFKTFVKENDALDLFERRIHQGNFRQFMSDHKDDGDRKSVV
jgi:hypothetical protein